MKSGTVDIRTRDNQRMGKMRIDKLHEYFQSLMPNKSRMYEQFYEKAWNPANFVDESQTLHEFQGTKEKCVLFSHNPTCPNTQMIQVVADISGVDLEVQAATDEKMPHMYMKVSDGSILTYPEAIIKHISRMNLSSGLIGKTAFDQAKDDEWITWCQTAWALPAHSAVC
jgi:hypothetical protein